MKNYPYIESIARALGYKKLLPLQEKAFRMPELYDPARNIFIQGNTSSGKTLIPLLHYISGREQNSIYKMLFLVPYRALASQKKDEIEELVHRKFPELRVYLSTGELRENDAMICRGDVDIAVVIYEKAYHFACSEPDFLGCYSVIVYDEFALAEDEHRGIDCDLMLLRGMQSTSKLFVLATPYYNWDNYIHNGKFTNISLSKQESEHLVPRDEIPIFIDKTSKNGKNADFHDFNREPLHIDGVRGSGTKDDLIEDLCIHHLEQGHRILVFMNDCQEVRRMANTFAERLQTHRPELMNPMEAGLHEDACFHKVLDETGLLDEDLIELMTPRECTMFYQGIAYHNSWLGYELRTLVEKELLTDAGGLKVVFSTETMAYGINSSVDVVIVASMYKSKQKQMLQCNPDSNKEGHMKVQIVRKTYTLFLQVNEYQNYIGRAGRYGRSEKGYAYALLTQTPGRVDVRKNWKRLLQLRENPPSAKSTLFRLDAFCNRSCGNRKDEGNKTCTYCNLYANELAMPVLSLIPEEGITYQQLRDLLLQLPGLRDDMEWVNRNLTHALGRLIYKTKPAPWVRFTTEQEAPYAKHYFLTPNGRAMCGMITTMYECDYLRNYLFGWQQNNADRLMPERLLGQLRSSPFDFFYMLCKLPELENLAYDFFAVADEASEMGRKRLANYNELCTQKLSDYYTTRRKTISGQLYNYLTYIYGDRRVYRITYPGAVYRLLLAITIYEWYRTASISALDRDLNAVPDTVTITPGRMARLTKQTSFYLQILSSLCSTMLDQTYEDIGNIIFQVELCLYFGIQEKNASIIPMEQLQRLTRQQQFAVSRIMEFCTNFPHPFAEKLTKREISGWKKIVRDLRALPEESSVPSILREAYPSLTEAEANFCA